MFILRKSFWANAVAAAAVFAVGGSAMANSNTGSGLTSSAGTSAGVVSGYDITAHEYTLNTLLPTNTDEILITYDGTVLGVPAKIRVSPTGASGTFYYTEAAAPAGNACTATATVITCLTTAAGGGHQGTVADVTDLTVVLSN